MQADFQNCISLPLIQKQSPNCVIKIVPRNFGKPTEKHLCQSVFSNKIAAFRPINSIIKQYCSCCIILIRIDTILSKNIQNNFQNLLFKKLLTQSGNQTRHVLEVLVAHRHTLVNQNCRVSVRLHHCRRLYGCQELYFWGKLGSQ